MEKLQTTAVSLNPSGDRPEYEFSVYIDPSARVIGKVTVGPRVYIGPFAVIRADETPESGEVAPIVIGAECNVQDGVILHSLAGESVTLGSRVSLAHGCVVHGPCIIENDCFIGFRATVFKATLGSGTYVGTGAIVEQVHLPAGTLVPAGSVINSAEAAGRLPKTGETERKFMKKVVATNLKLAEGYPKIGG